MRDQLEVLAALQSIDQDVKGRKTAQRELLAEIEKNEKDIATKSAELELLREEWSRSDAERQTKEQVLQAAAKKVTEKRMRMNQVKNVRELQALQREITQIKESNTIVEEELLETMTELETAAASLKEKEEELRALQEEWNAKKDKLKEEVASIEASLMETSKMREDTAGRLNNDLVGKYEMIFARRGGTAVVSLSSSICAACNMNIPPQLWNEVLRSEKLSLCPSCQRILYYRPPASDNDGQE